MTQQVDPTDFGTYLGDPSLNVDRANIILEQAQNACEQIVSPVPDDKVFVVYRVAERAYTSGRNQGRGYRFSGTDRDDRPSPGAAGIYLTEADRQDLLQGVGGGGSGGVFSVSVLPSDYCPPVTTPFDSDWETGT